MSTITAREGAEGLPSLERVTSQGVELRHLRYFVAVVDAGTFTHAAEQMFVAQPTLSQQIRQLEKIIGTPLLQRRPGGLRLTAAGRVLLEESRAVLSLVDHGITRTRQAAGLARPRLRFVVAPDLPDDLAVEVTSRLRRTAMAAGIDVAWLERPLDAGFSLIRQRRADAGLGWLTAGPETLPAPLEAMSLGEFEPEVWIPGTHPAARRGTISLGELAGLDVIHGPRRLSTVTHDAWLAILRAANPRFDFTDPPFRHSPPVTLAFTATSDRPAAVLTGPRHRIGDWPGPADPAAGSAGMVRARVEGSPLTAAAALTWPGDLCRPLQQVLFDAADGITFSHCHADPAAVLARHRLWARHTLLPCGPSTGRRSGWAADRSSRPCVRVSRPSAVTGERWSGSRANLVSGSRPWSSRPWRERASWGGTSGGGSRTSSPSGCR